MIRHRSLFSGGGGGGGGLLILGGGHYFLNSNLGRATFFQFGFSGGLLVSEPIHFQQKSVNFQETFSERFLSFKQISTLVLQTRRLLTFVGDGTILYIAAPAHF